MERIDNVDSIDEVENIDKFEIINKVDSIIQLQGGHIQSGQYRHSRQHVAIRGTV